MWKLVDQQNNVVGLMAIYVDDMLVGAEHMLNCQRRGNAPAVNIGSAAAAAG